MKDGSTALERSETNATGEGGKPSLQALNIALITSVTYKTNSANEKDKTQAGKASKTYTTPLSKTHKYTYKHTPCINHTSTSYKYTLDIHKAN